MADAMFGALTNGVGSHAGTKSISRSREQGPIAGNLRDPSRAGSASPAKQLRAWLLRLNALLEPPVCREQVGSGVLRILQDFFPSRQSALFVVDENEREMVAEGKVGTLAVAAARGVAMSLEEANWVEQTARECLSRCQVLGRESSGETLASFLWIPVLDRGRRIGVIELGDCSGHWFAGDLARELGLLADDVGRLLSRFAELACREGELKSLERDLAARTRECSGMRRQIRAYAGKEAISQMAIFSAERATDPSSFVLANLRSARDDIESMENVVDRLIEAAEAHVERAAGNEEVGLEALREALSIARTSRCESVMGSLGPLIEDVEAGAYRLRSIGEDFRELGLGDAAPVEWVDLEEVIERALAVIAHREGQHLDCELRVAELPPVRCQRIRIEALLVGILDRATSMASTESSLGIQADARGDDLIVEVSVDAVRTSEAGIAPLHAGADIVLDEWSYIDREIAEDQGGGVSVDTLDDLLVIRLSLPVDRG